MRSITIIGGGVIGVTLAYHLRDADASVRVLEKEGLGAGTTGKSIACFAWHLNHEGVYYDIAHRAWATYEPLIEDGTLSYHQNGFLKLAETDAFFHELKESVDALQHAGIPAEIPDDDTLENLNVNPGAAPAGAAWYPSIGRFDPGEILAHYYEAARAVGVGFQFGTQVTGVSVSNEAVTGVETTNGTIESDVVVNAAGPWAPILNRKAGIDLPLKHTLAPISVLETEENFDLPTVILENGVYFTGEQSAKTLAGYGPHESGDENHDLWDAALELDDIDAMQGVGIGSAGEDHRRMIAEHAAWAVPKLADAEVSNEWRGIRCITPDHRPLVGPTELEGYYVSTGMSGEGITLAPACAELLAHHLMTGETSRELAVWAPARFD